MQLAVFQKLSIDRSYLSTMLQQKVVYQLSHTVDISITIWGNPEQLNYNRAQPDTRVIIFQQLVYKTRSYCSYLKHHRPTILIFGCALNHIQNFIGIPSCLSTKIQEAQVKQEQQVASSIHFVRSVLQSNQMRYLVIFGGVKDIDKIIGSVPIIVQ